ncbi:McrB family protein [Fuchsiella alkaliacetigena]|uniref:McrB family protein n=1 Tax=Fuchsiella alkaliacetigena TaxID=957042 RepID=UPI00200B71B1|nr:AAA family ATPase [Fuchsiella alkaliacetigena]MCK8825423.1 AAA family ATPase [Fuchsiella alkaliacetigena]
MGTNRMEELKKHYMLGVLAVDEESYPRGLKNKSVTRMNSRKSNNPVIFYIKSISSSPKRFFELGIEDDLFVGFEQSFNPLGRDFLSSEFEYGSVDLNKKEKKIEEKLRGKLILFEPKIKHEMKNGEQRYHKNLDIIELLDYQSEDIFGELTELKKRGFKAVLSPQNDKKEFAQQLLNKKEVSFPNYNIKELIEFDLILNEDKLYFNLASGWQWVDENTCFHQEPEQIKVIPIPNEFYENVFYLHNQSLLFISTDYYKKLTNQAGIELTKDIKTEKFKETSITYSDEQRFLNSLKQKVLEEGLYYQQEDLYNLHISVKTNSLTIISGMSGTGKTKMAQLYADTLQANSKTEYLIIPISPSYTEPGDLLGYLNTMTGIYTPAETGLVDTLVEAHKNQDRLYLIIFDEMNLSQVEHWFSPFISILELEFEDRSINLYNSDNTCHNNNNYPSTIAIGENVKFIGTVNVDETTRDFSDRLLDRANVIKPSKRDFYQVKKDLAEGKFEQELGEINAKEYNIFNWVREPANSIEVMKEEELKLLDKLHAVINEIDAQKGVSFRILENIARYLENIPLDKEGELLISRADGFDLQLKQRVLTKLKGHQQQYGTLIGTLEPETEEEIHNSKIYEILSSELGQQVSAFSRSIAELKRKAREMNFNGYAT